MTTPADDTRVPTSPQRLGAGPRQAMRPLATLQGQKKVLACCLCLAAGSLLAGCGSLSVVQRNQVGLLSAATVGAATPGTELAQTYYLGSFDPRGQLPPSIYRIRVSGQASILNQTRFASGWAPAGLVDSLTSSINLDARNGTFTTTAAADPSDLSQAGRGLVLFGPEGFREAPRGHRLVIMMGSNPEMIEQAFSSALGTVAKVRFGQPTAALDRDLFDMLIKLGQERAKLEALGQQP